MIDPADRIAMLRLALIPGVGPRTRQALLDHFDSPTAVLRAPPAELRSVSGVGPKICAAIRAAADSNEHLAEIARCQQYEIDIWVQGDESYPQHLKHIHDPPGVLFRRGSWESRDNLAIAIVGTRYATQYGRSQAERLAMSLGRAGLTVVSGLARGIDAAAHRGALKSGGRTVAVLGSGLLQIYPPEHRALAAQIARQGAVLSEFPPTQHPQGGTFPQRNRVIAGLCLGVIVVEAPLRSGALITAEHAMEQGREVFAVPGPVDRPSSRGCHRLLREGARLVESIEDVLDELGPLADGVVVHDDTAPVRHPAELQLNDLERRVLGVIEQRPTLIDDIARNSQFPIQRVLSTISVLEMRHLVRRVSGNAVTRIG